MFSRMLNDSHHSDTHLCLSLIYREERSKKNKWKICANNGFFYSWCNDGENLAVQDFEVMSSELAKIVFYVLAKIMQTLNICRFTKIFLRFKSIDFFLLNSYCCYFFLFFNFTVFLLNIVMLRFLFVFISYFHCTSFSYVVYINVFGYVEKFSAQSTCQFSDVCTKK